MPTARPKAVLCVLLHVFGLLVLTGALPAAEEGALYVGWAEADITPPKPVAIIGFMVRTVSEGVLDPLTATVLALETKGEQGEQAIMVSCDLFSSRKEIQDRLRERVKDKIPDFDVQKLFMNATHVHSGPQLVKDSFYGLYNVDKYKGAMNASQYGELFLERVSDAVVKAWKDRKRGGVSWGYGRAALADSRRVVLRDGTAQMGGPAAEEFSHFEGYNEHGVDMLFLWDANRRLTGVVLNVCCPAQMVGWGKQISADYWHDVRKEIRKRHGKDMCVFAQCAAAGDIGAGLNVNARAEKLMLERKGLTRREEAAQRIADAVGSVLPYARKDIRTSVVFKHTVAKVRLPEKDPPNPKNPHPYPLPQRNDRPPYNWKTDGEFYKYDTVEPLEFHVIRLGDVALATNPFEMFLDYGIRIKAGSAAVHTFIVQLSGHHCGYLPTRRAIGGGGYSAVNYLVGPQGGDVLVRETVRNINVLWGKTGVAPQGFHLAAQDDCGNPGHQPNRVIARNWPLTAKEKEGLTIDDPRLLTFSFHDKAVMFRYNGLDPNAKYKVRVYYFNVAWERVVELSADGEVLHDGLDLPKGKLLKREFELAPELYKDGTVELWFKKLKGPHAIVSAIELWVAE